MTKPLRCVFAVPTHSLDEVPRGNGSRLSQDYLNAWTALWDPRLLDLFQAVPEWRRGDTSGLDLEDSLIAIPEMTRQKLDQPLEERLRLQRNTLSYSNLRSRQDFVEELLQTLSVASPPVESPPVESSKHSPALLHDFYAFGFVVFHIQVMARKLRYSSNLDWMVIGEQLLNASRASLAGDVEETDRWLQAAFDSVSRERDRYCSQQGNLLDLVLVADSTIGNALTEQLGSEHPLTLFATAKTLGKLKQENAQAWDQLIRRQSEETISISGGCEEEQAQCYLTERTALHMLDHGQSTYRSLGVQSPKTFLQFSPGYSPNLPTWLHQFGYVGAFVSAWTGGTVPNKEHAKVRWQQSTEGPTIDCVLGHVLDAVDAESMLSLSTEMSSQLDYHQVPTLVLAHWPNQACDAYHDLLRAAKRTPALGKFSSADKYFASTAQPYWTDQYASNQFRVPLESSPGELNDRHSQIRDRLIASSKLERLESTELLWSHVSKVSKTAQSDRSDVSESIRERIKNCFETLSKKSDGIHLHATMDSIRETLVHEIGERLGNQPHWTVVNSASHARRVFLDSLPGQIDADSCDRLVASEVVNGQSLAIFDLPPFGFAHFRMTDLPKGMAGAASSLRPSFMQKVFGARSAIVSEDWSLANEFMEMQIDVKKGHMRSLYVPSKRGNRLSAMLSFVERGYDPSQKLDDSSFTSLQDYELRVIENSKTRGIVEAAGKGTLKNGSKIDCVIRYTLWKGARWFDVEIDVQGLQRDHVYPVWRIAFANEGTTISAWQQGVKGKLNSPLQGSTELIELDDAEYRIYVATSGLSANRRMGHNTLISAIPVDAIGKASAKLSIGLDWARPWETAMDRMEQAWLIPPSKGGGAASSSTTKSAWLAQCNMPNVRFGFLNANDELRIDTGENSGESTDSPVSNEQMTLADSSIWMVETQGKSGIAKFQFLKNVRGGWRVDFLGREFDRLKVEDGQLLVPYKPWERSRVAICFE